MATSPGALGRRYAPFIALAAVQVLLVAVVPSKSPKRTNDLAAIGPSGSNSSVTGSNGTSLGTGSANTATGSDAVSSGVGTSASGTGTRPGSATQSTVAGTDVTDETATDGSDADLSKCDPAGYQIGPTYFMPKCAPVWHGGNNGGNSMTGVYDDHIDFVFYAAKSDPQVNAILETQGLAASKHDQCAAWDAFTKELNKRWEFYGRKLISRDGPGANKGSTSDGCDNHFTHFAGQCSLTPPDPPCERAEAAQIAAMKPAYVIAPVADPAFFNELGKRGIIVSGGNSAQAPAPASYFTDVAPYYYDVVMDGTRILTILAEYYCKKLYGKPPKFAGPDVAIAKTRKIGITYPSTNGDPTAKISAEMFVRLITGGMCGKPSDGVVSFSYESDISRAQQQAQTTVAAMKKAGVTTVVCFCDPIAPLFFVQACDQQTWHPEHLLAGDGLIDYDVLGRLYGTGAPAQWAHAFGPSELYHFPPIDQYDSAKAWRDVGNSGLPDPTENLAWSYFALMGTSFQLGGPAITPDNIRNGLFRAPARGGWEESKHNPQYPLIKFGSSADDYTGIDDIREVWWSQTAKSNVDGKPGAYVEVDGGHRYQKGEIPPGDPKVFQ